MREEKFALLAYRLQYGGIDQKQLDEVHLDAA